MSFWSAKYLYEILGKERKVSKNVKVKEEQLYIASTKSAYCSEN